MTSAHGRFRRGALGAFVAVAVAAVGSIPATATAGQISATAGTQQRATQNDPTASAVRTLTLITGDRIRAYGDGPDRVEFVAGPGRRAMTYLTSRAKGRLSIIPMDAVGLVRSGRLDPRLFDVTTLLEFGYDDRRAELPLLMTYDTARLRSAALGTVRAAGARVTRELPAVWSVAVGVSRARATDIWLRLTEGDLRSRQLRGGVGKVWLDGIRRPTLDHSVPQVGAPAAWQAGYDGSGVTVAVLDTGVDVDHPDLAGKVTASANFSEGMEDDRDLVGHGTHVAATIAGGSAGGRYPGVAPGAKLLNGKVCAASGCPDSWVLAGMTWAVENGADVVNLSLGAADSPGVDLLEQAVDELSDQYGTLFVAAAGNDGAESTISSPASADAALAVGAVDDQDRLAPFSSRGPRADSGVVKPDLAAPGVGITAARGADASVGGPGDSHVSMSGTSMATPHVAGAAAILAQRHPDWSGPQLKAALTSSAQPHPDLDPYGQGAGRLDVARTIGQPVRSDSGSVDFGRMLWPHHDDVPGTRKVSYRNTGPTPIRLSFEMQVTGPDDKAAPAGMFTLEAASTTVPPGSQAEVALTVDTRVTGADGDYTGYLRATAPGIAVSTPIVVEREVESYDLTLTHLDRAGQRTGRYGTTVAGLDVPDYAGMSEPGTTDDQVLRLPKGDYVLTSWIDGGWEADPYVSVLAQPRLVLDRAQTVTVDARLAQPVSITVPDPTAEEQFLQVDGSAELSWGWLRFGATILDGHLDAFTGRIGPAGTSSSLVTSVGATYAQVGPEQLVEDSYDLRWVVDQIPTGFRRTVARPELAEVRLDHGQQVPGTIGQLASFAEVPDRYEQTLARSMLISLPGTRSEFHNTDGGVGWYKAFLESLPTSEGRPQQIFSQGSPLVRYVAGRIYREQWNRGVFAPAFPAPPRDPRLWITRTGDTLEALPPLYGDSGGREGSAVAAMTYTLYRNGVRFGTAELPHPTFTLPAEAATYRLEVTADRAKPGRVSTQTRVAWTFQSGRSAGETPTPMALSVVRFTPTLDASSTAPADRPTIVPVTVQQQAGSAAKPAKQLTVEVSFDDGMTWRGSTLRDTAKGKETVVTPPGPGFVSLRARSVDNDGNAVDQTIIRAYEVR